jgi:hypothetical protein
MHECHLNNLINTNSQISTFVSALQTFPQQELHIMWICVSTLLSLHCKFSFNVTHVDVKKQFMKMGDRNVTVQVTRFVAPVSVLLTPECS